MNYLFIGNRFFVLQAMLEQGLKVPHILAVKDSYLAKELVEAKIEFTPIESKQQAIDAILAAKFDILVSNGCPFILPSAALQKRCINVHPSYLPDLKGFHPINGAILFNRTAGASCHVMDESIDGGPLIARIPIPLTSEMTLARLYALSFAAEREVFLQALARDFAPDLALAHPLPYTPIYYTRKEGDLRIDFSEDAEAICRRVRAFGIPSQGAYFVFKGENIKVLEAEIMYEQPRGNLAEGEVVRVDDKSITFRRGNALLEFKNISGDLSGIKLGDKLI